MSHTIRGKVTGASDRGACARIFHFSDMIILKIWLLGSLSSRIFGSTPIDDNTPPDPWVREEFEVETGRVVHQETIEGEPPRRCCNH